MTYLRLFALSPLMIFLLLSGCTKSCEKQSLPAAEPAKRVYFITPHDGDKVPSTFEVKFGLEGMKIRPAGEDPLDKTSGHHHILIDNEKGYVEKGDVTPKDSMHIHYGKGETETRLTLPPGRHKLTLQFADGAHLSYGKEMSQSITVVVEPPVPTL